MFRLGFRSMPRCTLAAHVAGQALANPGIATMMQAGPIQQPSMPDFKSWRHGSGFPTVPIDGFVSRRAQGKKLPR